MKHIHFKQRIFQARYLFYEKMRAFLFRIDGIFLRPTEINFRPLTLNIY